MPPAARVTDITGHPGTITGPGVPTVLIGGLVYLLVRAANGSLYRYPYSAPYTGKYQQPAYRPYVGPYATVPLGDYTAGPNHTLPTSGAARFSSPLGVHTFLKRSSVLSLDRSDLEMLRDASVRLAEMEGLDAHAHAIEVRLE